MRSRMPDHNEAFPDSRASASLRMTLREYILDVMTAPRAPQRKAPAIDTGMPVEVTIITGKRTMLAGCTNRQLRPAPFVTNRGDDSIVVHREKISDARCCASGRRQAHVHFLAKPGAPFMQGPFSAE